MCIRDRAYTVKLTAAGTQPEVKLNYNNAAVTVTSSVKSGAVNGKGVDAAYFSGSETSKSVNSGAQATDVYKRQAIMLPINDKTRRWNMPCEGRRGPDAGWRLSMRESHSCRECEGTAGPACT